MGGLIRPTPRTGWLPPSPRLKSHCERTKTNTVPPSSRLKRDKDKILSSCGCSDYYVKMYPDSPMTGAWLTDFSFRMSIVSRQDRDGNSVRGRDRWRHLIVTFHHLQKGKKSFRTNPQLRLDFGELVECISHHGLVFIGVSGLMKPLSHIQLLLMNFDLDANKHPEKSLIQSFILYSSLSQLLYSGGQVIYGSRVAAELRCSQVKPTRSKFLSLHQIFSLILKE